MINLTTIKRIIRYIKTLLFAFLLLLIISLIGEVTNYQIPDTDIYDSISPPYILYVEDSPGLCHYWFYDTDGTIQPLLIHQLNNNQFGGMLIYERQYRILRR